jgi:hypothetical protein
VDIAYRAGLIYAILFLGDLGFMENNQEIWRKWASILQNWGMHEIAASLLDAVRPVFFVFSQVIFIGHPFLNLFFSEKQITAFTGLFDEPNEANYFINSLRYPQKSITDNVNPGD